MFEQIKEWLDSLTPEQKKELIDNLNNFQRIKTLLEARKIVIPGENPGELLLVEDHAFSNLFLQLGKKLNMRGVKIIDKRKNQKSEKNQKK